MKEYTVNHPVFDFFKAINHIPRGSGNEQAISDFMVSFAKERGIYVRQDDKNNIIMKKPGTSGYENSPAIILQGHLDMVCEKNADKNHDFTKDPIAFIVDGEFVRGDKTTLGADNGIALAYTLALLDSNDIPHPPIEVIMTTDEEVGLKGATSLDVFDLTGKLLINLDSEEEGEILVSCAGGVRAYLKMTLEKEATHYENQSIITVGITGLKGGHSGMDIDKSRGNANKIIGRVLNELVIGKIPYKIISLNGGSKDNAIPREAFLEILVDDKYVTSTKEVVDEFSKVLKSEYHSSDNGLAINLTDKKVVDEVITLTTEQSLKIPQLLLIAPNGILTYSLDIPGLIESSINLGVLVQTDTQLKLAFAIRSSLKSLKAYQMNQITALGQAFDLEVTFDGNYPEWEFMKDSVLRDKAIKVYETNYGKTPLIKAIHAGLECGVFAAKIEGLDMISIGPNMFDVHTPEERLEIGSTMRTWEYLLKILEALK